MARFAAEVLGKSSSLPEHEASAAIVDLVPVAGRVRSNIACDLRATAGERWPSRALLGQLCLCAALEGADQVLLPSTLKALQADLGLSMHSVAAVALAQAICLSGTAPLWGVLADRRILQRKTILAFGAVCQGLLTIFLGTTSSFAVIAIVRAMNGMMLSALKPTVGGIVPDVTSPVHRGRVFGYVNTSVQIGMTVGSLIAVPISTRTVFGVRGWRVAYALVGGVSVLVGLVVQLTMAEPEREAPAAGTAGKRPVLGELQRLLGYFRMSTFGVIIVQGCFGTVPGNGLAFLTLFYQLSGISNRGAATLEATRMAMAAIGQSLGGRIGDWMASKFPLRGRALTAQVSVLSGIPITLCIFGLEPPSGGAFYYYLVLVSMLSLSATWCSAGVNLPLLSELVDADGRSTIIAWDQALEGSFGALFGNLAVGLLSADVFGYDLSASHARQEGRVDRVNQRALGMALLFTCCVPWTICIFLYSLLHWSYPRDLRTLRARRHRSYMVLPGTGEAEEEEDDEEEEQSFLRVESRSPTLRALAKSVARA